MLTVGCLIFGQPILVRGSLGIAGNGLRLCAVGEIEVQMFNLAQMLIRNQMLKFSTYAPIAQNRCWWQFFYILYMSLVK
jgi:hypothetical protein